MRALCALLVVSTGCRAILGIDEPVEGGPAVHFELASTMVDEETGSVMIPVVLDAPTATGATVEWDIVGGSASEQDFQIEGDRELVFAAGETRKDIVLAIVADGIEAETIETIELELVSAIGARIGNDRDHVVEISPLALPRVAFFNETSLANESDSATISLTLSKVSDVDVIVELSSGGGSASDTDFDFPATTMIPKGLLFSQPVFAAMNDTMDENDETAVLSIVRAENAVVGVVNEHTHTITDDDMPPTIRFQAASSNGSEGNTVPVTIQITLSAPSGKTINAMVTTNGGTATENTDWQVGGGAGTLALTFAPGETTKTVQIVHVNDAADEPNETIVLGLANVVNASIGTPPTHTRTIVDDDN
jgi:hypothetical protein